MTLYCTHSISFLSLSLENNIIKTMEESLKPISLGFILNYRWFRCIFAHIFGIHRCEIQMPLKLSLLHSHRTTRSNETWKQIINFASAVEHEFFFCRYWQILKVTLSDEWIWVDQRVKKESFISWERKGSGDQTFS